MSKALLVVGGGMEAVPGIRRAKEMGLHVVVSDGNPTAPGFALADDRIVVSTYDIDGTVAAAKRYHRKVRPLDGVICIAADVPLTVACVAAELGLPGIPVEAARLAADKLAMKCRLVECGVAVPWFSPVANPEHLRFLIKERGYPLVLKPVDSRGARGVLKLTPGVSLEWAYSVSLSHSPSGRVMVEEFIPGLQVSTESVLLDGGGYTPGFVDRNYDLMECFSPYIVEDGGQQPSILAAEARDAVAELAVRAARALGIQAGTVKGDMVWTPEGPMVIEVAPRLSGGWLSSDQIPLATGVDVIGAAIRLALGERVSVEELQPKYYQAVAIRYFFPKPGRVIRIRGLEKFRAAPWVHKIMLFVEPGDIIAPVTDHTKRAGCVITIGESREQAVVRAREVVAGIQIETAPV